MLITSSDIRYTVNYEYGQDGNRSNKYTITSETLYANKMWSIHTDSGNSFHGGQSVKNIYLGDTRIVTRLNSAGAGYGSDSEENHKTYYYHSDHLGSASLITDCNGQEYQRIEYTPYGEVWVDKTSNTGSEYLPYKFTGKEMDQETGLYYYGARYLDPTYSIWISADPALGDYIPQSSTASGAHDNNTNLPGMGGVYNHINFHLYHYAGNNPIRYLDPDGRFLQDADYVLEIKHKNFVSDFKSKVFTASNPLNQLEFDKALRISSDSKTTQSCYTVAIINAYAANCKNGISGEEILNALTSENGCPNELLEPDGSPNSEKGIDSISKALAKEKGLDKFIHVGFKRMNLKIWGSAGVITGLSKKGESKDSHFVYEDKKNGKLDSLDPKRPSAKKYTDNSHRTLIWRKLLDE